jgi:hypothetical protein
MTGVMTKRGVMVSQGDDNRDRRVMTKRDDKVMTESAFLMTP